ncbi:MAG: hypothetical protein WA885_23900 [Phormidesmis sp.]
MSKNWKADYLEEQLADLERNIQSIRKRLRVETNPITRNQFEIQIEEQGKLMDEVEQQLEAHRLAVRQRAAQAAQTELISILNLYKKTQFDLMRQAYLQTIARWPGLVSSQVADAQTLVAELNKIAKGDSPYSARSEFIAHLIHLASAPGLAPELNAWGDRYQPNISWSELYRQIEAEQKEKLATVQPAILIAFDWSEDASAQSIEDPLYDLHAWLIEDIETYKSQSLGCVSLRSCLSEITAYPIETLLAKMPALLNAFLAEKNRRYPNCQNYSEVHIFLPLELMDLAVDMWQLDNPKASPKARQADCLGHRRPVIVHCSDRYSHSYSDAPIWKQHWKRSQQFAQRLAKDAFVSGHDEDLDNLMELLEDAIMPADSTIVGLQMTHAPANLEGMCNELLKAGIPLAIWPRENLDEDAHCDQLSRLLAEGCLSAFPHTVQRNRREASFHRNPKNRHIGHHLSLLWDDPDLAPPKKSAQAA